MEIRININMLVWFVYAQPIASGLFPETEAERFFGLRPAGLRHMPTIHRLGGPGLHLLRKPKPMRWVGKP
jgi:hypothetical protein